MLRETAMPEPDSHSRNKRKIELDFSNYATKSDLKGATGIDTPEFAKEIELAGLKSNVDKLDIGKLKPFPNGLSELSNVIAHDKKRAHDDMIKIVDNIDLNKQSLEKKIKDVWKQIFLKLANLL